MKQKPHRAKRILWHLAAIVIGAAIGAMAGLVGSRMIEYLVLPQQPGARLAAVVAILLGLWVILQLTIILHEAGHLVFGLARGWRFVSFRVGKWVLIRKDGRFSVRRFTIAGTGGQCLMEPVSDDPPFVLYNLGGPLVNLAQGLLVFVPGTGLARLFLLAAGLFGVLMGIINLLPVGGIPTDGNNLMHLCRNARERRSFATMLRINAILTRGGSMRDVPAEWLPAELPADDEAALVLSDYIAAADRMLACGAYTDALARYQYILDHCGNLYDVHRNEVSCCALTLEYLIHGDTDAAKALDTKALRRYEKATALYPARCALAYARARAHGQDSAKALAAFDKAAAHTPYPGDAADWRAMLDAYAEPLCPADAAGSSV